LGQGHEKHQCYIGHLDCVVVAVSNWDIGPDLVILVLRSGRPKARILHIQIAVKSGSLSKKREMWVIRFQPLFLMIIALFLLAMTRMFFEIMIWYRVKLLTYLRLQ
jgi:hypothetical protein